MNASTVSPARLATPERGSGPVDEVDAVLWEWTGPLLVLGAPGTGKTSLVARAAVRALRSGDRPPLVIATSRAAASGLRNRIALGVGRTSQPAVTTVHALCRNLVERFSDDDAGRRLLTAPEQEFRVRELLRESAAGWPVSLRQAVDTRGFARQVRGVLARARQLGLDPEDVVRFGEAADLPEWVAVGRFFAEYLDVLDAEQVLDYAELVHRARILVADPEVAASLLAELGSVLVDDVVDLDPAQVGLVRALVPPGESILATADPLSAVNAFRGAHPRIATDFPAIFTSSTGAPAVVRQLSEGHRMVTEVAAVVARIAARLPQTGGRPLPATPAPGAGTVDVVTCSSEAAQAAAIATRIRRAHLLQGIEYSDMAVLVRSGRAQLPLVARALAAAGVPVDVAADEIVLAASQAVRPLLLALEVVERGTVEPSEAERLLTSPLAGFDPISLRHLVRQWRAAHRGATLETGGIPSTAEVLAAALNGPGWAAAATSPQQRRLVEFVRLLDAAREACDAERRPDEVAWQLWRGSNWPARLRDESLRGGQTGRQADRDLDAVLAFFELAGDTATGQGATAIRAFLAEVASQQIPADRERESRLAARGVQVLTVHRAKGRQWSVVVVAGAQEGAWPPGRRVSSVLEPQRLTSSGIGPRADPREQLADERRLFHLACSRARRQLMVTSTVGVDGEANQPSRFVGELGVDPHPAIDGPPVTLPGLVARLRRVLLEPGTPLGERQGAAAALARLASASDDAGRPLVPAADPSRWWGVREVSSPARGEAGSIRLSPSQVGEILTCPRRYFLNRSARAGGPPVVSASLGSVIHLVVQHANRTGPDLGEVGAYLDAAWQHLRFEAGWLSAVERAEAEVCVERFLAWREQRPNELVGTEVPFEMTVDAGQHVVTVAGTVDRLERTPLGLLRVVDFKTGRVAPTKVEVAGMEQLGIYQLAVEAGAFAVDGSHGAGGSAGAAAVFLRKPGARDDLPREFSQEPLSLRPHLSDDPEEVGFPTWVHQRISQAAAVAAEGQYRAAPGPQCRRCAFADSCPASGRGEQVLR
ncbi:MAG: ATP-dependent DNA helicase [Propionicimonas sp.]